MKPGIFMVIVAAGWSIMISIMGCSRMGQDADLVLKNGIFFTADGQQPTVQAVSIRGDRILVVGREAEHRIGDRTRVIDLEGKFGCPGFNDAHLHLKSGGMRMMEADLVGVRSAREIQGRVLRHLSTLPPNAWITGGGWDQSLFEDKKWPTRKILDLVAPDVPIFLQRIDNHSVLVNSRALRIAGIGPETPDPPFGRIERDPATGAPTGILKESAINLVSQYIPEPSRETLIRAVEFALAEAARFGVTSMQDNSMPDLLPIFETFEKEGRLTCRISEWPLIEGDSSAFRTLRQKYDGNMIRFGLLKGYIDGSMGSRSALFFEPYFDDPGNFGIPQITQNDLDRRVITADREGYQVGIHAIGDRGVRMALDAFEAARKRNGVRDSRHRVEHAQVLDAKDLPRFRALGVVASMQPSHCIDDMRWMEDRIGPDRCRYAFAWRSLKQSGAVLAFGTDWPWAPLNPLVGLYAAVTRRDTTGHPPEGWYPRERLTMAEAIEAYTMGSAYAQFMDKDLGSLEAGKLADIVVFDRNLLEADPGDLLRARVVLTVMNGKVVFEGQ